MTSRGAHAETRRMMETAIRRLNVLEYVILGVAMALALLAGWLAAWLVESLTGAPFRPTWAISSLLFFVVPGLIVLSRERRAGAASILESEGTEGTEGAGATDEGGGNAGDAGTADPANTADILEERDDGGR